jgi:hypothetical protein
MKRLVLAVLTILGSAGLATAQNAALDFTTSSANRTPRFTAASEGIQLVSSVRGDTIAVPSSLANPAEPQPEPKFYYGNSEDYRFQLGIGYEYVHFQSTPFNANLNGLHTSLTYYLNDWFGLEGSTVAAFGTKVSGSTSKYFLYTGGGRIAWRDTRRRYEPWMHALVGGLHMIPQTAVGGKNGFAFQAGAGVDFRINSRLSFRAEGDYVHSQLYSESQNNFQFGGGAVIHF